MIWSPAVSVFAGIGRIEFAVLTWGAVISVLLVFGYLLWCLASE